MFPQYDVDPDRVDVAGFSMSGTGSWFLAGRHPDLFAGAAPFSGVLMASPKSELATREDEGRGARDPARPRAERAQPRAVVHDPARPSAHDAGDVPLRRRRAGELARAGRGGLEKIRFEAFPGLVHEFPPREPARGLELLPGERRERFPTRLVWEYTSDPSPSPEANDPVPRLQKTRFHSVGLPRAARLPDDPRGARGEHDHARALADEGRREGPHALPRAEHDRPERRHDREARRRAALPRQAVPDVWTALETYDDKLDRALVFDRRIEL